MIKFSLLLFLLILQISCLTKKSNVDLAADFVLLIQEKKMDEAEKLMTKDYLEIQQISKPELFKKMDFIHNKIKSKEFDKEKYILKNDNLTVWFPFDDITIIINFDKNSPGSLIESFYSF